MATDETYSSLESPAFYSPSSSTLSRPPTSNTAGKSDTSMTLKRPYYAAMDEIGSPDEELMNSSSGMMMEDQEGNMGECIQLQLAAGQARGDQHQKRARRLTVEQVRALERAFDVENKLEPDRKSQLASQLGLQERQVAVWFQNRRARCKTKQMEKDFQALKKKMELLKADRDKLISEKEQLEAEVQRLKREMKEKERQEVKQEDQVIGSAAMVINVKVKPQSPAPSSRPQDELMQQQQQQHDQQSPAETKRSSPSSAASEINTNCKRSSNHNMAYNSNSERECDVDASMNNGGSINTNLPQESNSADGSALDHVDSSSSTLDQLLISRISPPLNQINHANINHPNHNLQDHPYGNNLHGHNLDQNYGFLDVYDAYGCISAVHLKGLDFLPKEEGFVPMADWWEAS